MASTIKGHQGPARAAGFRPDGTQVATAGEDGDVALADVDGKNRSVLLTISSAKDTDTYPNSVEFSSDATRLVVGARDNTVRLINLRDRTSRVLGRHGPGVGGVPGVRMARFNKAATKVVSAGFDGLARIWDVGSGTSASKRLVHGKTSVVDASFSPDGRRVATASIDGYLRIWDAGSGRLVTEVKVLAQDLLSVRYSRNGRRLVTGAIDGVVRVHDARQALPLAELVGSVGIVYDAAFAAGGAIVSSGDEGALRIWAPVKTTALRGEATLPSFSADGKHVVSGDYQGHMHRWDIATGRDRSLRSHGDASVVQESADGSRIVSAAEDGTVQVTDVKSGRSRRMPSDTKKKYAVAIDRTGRRIAVGGQNGPIRIHADDGSEQRVLRGHTDDVSALAFSPDAKHLASASTDGTARIFDVETGQPERTLRGHADTVEFVAYSADGKRIVTAGTDATIRIWSVKYGPPKVLYGHEGIVNSAVFNRGGDRLVSAGEDGTVRVWAPESGGSLVVLQRYGVAHGADFSPNGKRVVSAGGEGISNRGIVRVSACEVCGPFTDVLQLARTRRDRKLSPADRQQLLTGAR